MTLNLDALQRICDELDQRHTLHRDLREAAIFRAAIALPKALEEIRRLRVQVADRYYCHDSDYGMIDAAMARFWTAWPSFAEWWMTQDDGYGEKMGPSDVPHEPFADAILPAVRQVQDEAKSRDAGWAAKLEALEAEIAAREKLPDGRSVAAAWGLRRALEIMTRGSK